MTIERVSPSGPVSEVKTTVAVDSAAVGAATTVWTEVALTDAKAGDQVSVSPRVDFPAGIVLAGARVPSDGLLRVGLGNLTAAPIDPPSITYDVNLKRR